MAVPARMKARRAQIGAKRGAGGGANRRNGWTTMSIGAPQAETRSMEYRSRAMRGLSLGCPSIDPDLRYRFLVLHERCADFDRGLFLHELEAQSPAAGGGIRLGDDVLDFGLLGRHDAAQG